MKLIHHGVEGRLAVEDEEKEEERKAEMEVLYRLTTAVWHRKAQWRGSEDKSG